MTDGEEEGVEMRTQRQSEWHQKLDLLLSGK